jgi:hypothetical protein
MKLNIAINEIDARAEKLKFASDLYKGNTVLGTAHYEILQTLGDQATKKQIESQIKAFKRLIPPGRDVDLLSNLCKHYGC